nr:hypothetical protein CFP56_37770 [Quercus suber]
MAMITRRSQAPTKPGEEPNKRTQQHRQARPTSKRTQAPTNPAADFTKPRQTQAPISSPNPDEPSNNDGEARRTRRFLHQTPTKHEPRRRFLHQRRSTNPSTDFFTRPRRTQHHRRRSTKNTLGYGEARRTRFSGCDDSERRRFISSLKTLCFLTIDDAQIVSRDVRPEWSRPQLTLILRQNEW